MIDSGRIVRLIAVCAVAATLGACANNYPTRAVSYKETPIDRPAAQPADTELLGVRIEAFNPGKLPEDPNVAKGLSTEIRNVEAHYLPVQLKNTMQKSGHWAAVRVTPRGGREGEIVVTGTILESDGEILALEIDVRDATGVRWFTRKYESVVDEGAYRKGQTGGVDAFQDMFNRIANDIAAHRKALRPEDAAAIRQVAELRFGAEFAPGIYDAYLRKADETPQDRQEGLQQLISFFKNQGAAPERKPVYTVQRLPPENDPLIQRVSRIRAREEILVDTLDQQYDGLARDVGGAYTNWRTSRLKEMAAIRASDRAQNEEQAKAVAIGVIGVLVGAALASQNSGGNCPGCTTAGTAVAIGATAIAVQMALRASETAKGEAILRKAALEELGNSLTTDVKATVVEVEGQTVELKGSIEEKFQAWREALKQLRDNETAPLPAPPQIPTN